MAVLTLTQTINRPVEDVFSTVVDGGNFATWNPTIRSSRQLTEGEVGEGTMFEWQLKGFGRVTQEVQEFERNRRVRIVPHVKTLEGGHRFTLAALGAGTRVDHELEMVPKGIFRLLAPIVIMTGRRNLRATAAALKNHLEEG